MHLCQLVVAWSSLAREALEVIINRTNIESMIVDHATQQIIASECHLDGKLYVYVEICKDEKHKFALAQNH